MSLAARIREVSATGRLALGLYLVPGFPDWESSYAAVSEAARLGVSFIEFPVLTRLNWSDRTGATIARALSGAGTGTSEWSPRLAEWFSRVELAVGVVYSGAWPEPERWCASPELLRLSSGLLLEDDPPDWTSRAKQAADWDAPLVCAVNGRIGGCTAEDREMLAAGGGFIYVSLGERTGERAPVGRAARSKVEALRDARPDLPICCAFGIADARDLAEVRETTGCDGAIVGTAALEALEKGTAYFGAWLETMSQEAGR